MEVSSYVSNLICDFVLYVLKQELSYKLTNKLIHTPTQTMQSMMRSGNAEGLHAFSNALHLTHPLNEKND